MLKKILLFLTFFSLAASLYAKEKLPTQVGRYQISTVYNPDYGTEVYLVDTVTGTVWRNKRKLLRGDYGLWKELPALSAPPSAEGDKDCSGIKNMGG
ncbi:hypothetical protein [Parachlamydia sp. AcF125]|uniref:hypothetical protein n=1 Tax=Parachlamydia sp. AcF125 TaxID=2795736 RepID=UPI001BC9B716|nr:hypothetical protein [Parachlamydia sp. AcF125]MBS4168580.1 hypothetical protein [Parachlamydia sp. AcF125]